MLTVTNGCPLTLSVVRIRVRKMCQKEFKMATVWRPKLSVTLARSERSQKFRFFKIRLKLPINVFLEPFVVVDDQLELTVKKVAELSVDIFVVIEQHRRRRRLLQEGRQKEICTTVFFQLLEERVVHQLWSGWPGNEIEKLFLPQIICLKENVWKPSASITIPWLGD